MISYRVTVQDADGYREVSRTASGPFYHGGRARLAPGGLVKPGHKTNSWGDIQGRSREVFFSASFEVAAAYARSTGGRLYEVEPAGECRPDVDPDSFRSDFPLRVIRRVELV